MFLNIQTRFWGENSITLNREHSCFWNECVLVASIDGHPSSYTANVRVQQARKERQSRRCWFLMRTHLSITVTFPHSLICPSCRNGSGYPTLSPTLEVLPIPMLFHSTLGSSIRVSAQQHFLDLQVFQSPSFRTRLFHTWFLCFVPFLAQLVLFKCWRRKCILCRTLWWTWRRWWRRPWSTSTGQPASSHTGQFQ